MGKKEQIRAAEKKKADEEKAKKKQIEAERKEKAAAQRKAEQDAAEAELKKKQEARQKAVTEELEAMKHEMASLFGTPKPDPTKAVIKPKTKKEIQAFSPLSQQMEPVEQKY